MHDIPVPNLTTAHQGPLFQVEELLLDNVSIIESWFRDQWQLTPPSVTSSVDLRHAGFKIAPVDTNLFPAGFNNLNPDFLSLCVQAIQSTLYQYLPNCKRILILPENHTRNAFYAEHLNVLKDILFKAGFEVRFGSLNMEIDDAWTMTTPSGECLTIEPLIRQGDKILLNDFDPCVVLLNNDLSTGVPAILEGVQQRILPSIQLGWSNRLKSDHFDYYNDVAQEFGALIGLDPWVINPIFAKVHNIDFMSQAGLDSLEQISANILHQIAEKYSHYAVRERPFIIIKADNGTYGMSVMSIHSVEQLQQLNRKQRTRMAASKGSQAVTKVIIQEGVYTFEEMANGAVAEPVVYMIGSNVVGGFYRVHQERGIDENLNAPGMHFEPLAFAEPCNTPSTTHQTNHQPNRFYAYGVIARLAALAAARELHAVGDSH